jgi:transcriptional regulator with XRE-family HTH domain
MIMNASINNFQASQANTLALTEVASLVSEARRAAGYSVDDLAVTTGLISDEIVGIENGTELDPAKLKRVTTALKVSIPALHA